MTIQEFEPKIELLGFQQSEEAETKARDLLGNLVEIPLNAAIAEQTIQLRKLLKIDLHDFV
jgi:hypothetical protein